MVSSREYLKSTGEENISRGETVIYSEKSYSSYSSYSRLRYLPKNILYGVKACPVTSCNYRNYRNQKTKRS